MVEADHTRPRQPDSPAFAISFNSFDSKLLAGKVGIVAVPSSAVFSPELEERIAGHASRERYDLLCLKTPWPVASDWFRTVGVMSEYTCGTEELMTRLAPAAGRCRVRDLTDNDWEAVAGLLQYAPPTRFCYDQRLSPEVVHRHKLKLYQDCRDRFPAHALLAIDTAGNAVGYQFSQKNHDSFLLYDVCVHPRVRATPTAACILAENLARAMRLNPRPHPVVTKIYDDNLVSQRFFTRLGLEKTGRIEYWSHAWLADRERGIRMKEKLKEFLSNKMLVEFDGQVTDDTDLFRGGLIDSYGYVELVTFLETEFRIKITEEDLFSDVLQSVASMEQFVQTKQAATRQAA